MTQFVRNLPALRASGKKLLAAAGAAAWGAAGLLAARCSLFGLALPFAAALVLTAPAGLLPLAAAGGVLGSLLFLPTAAAARQIAAIGGAVLARLIWREKDSRLPMFLSAAGLLAAETAVQLRLGGSFGASFAAMAQAGVLLALAESGAQLFSAAAKGGVEYALKKYRAQGALWLAAAVGSLACYAPLQVSLAAVAASCAALWLYEAARHETAVLLALTAALSLTAADQTLAAPALGMAAGILVVSLTNPAGRTKQAAVFAGAACWGLAAGGIAALGGLAATTLGAALFLLLPAQNMTKVRADDPAAACAAKLTKLSCALADVSDTVTKVCTALPTAVPQGDLSDALCAGVCKHCRHSCVCWVERANDTADGLLKLMEAGTASLPLPPQLAGCVCPELFAKAVNDYFARRLALRCAAVRTGALRSAVTEQLGVLSHTLADTARSLTVPTPVLRYRAQVATQGDAAQEISADAQRSLTDEEGWLHLILADGTGTGRAAAVDGTLAVSLMRRLLAAGFDTRAAAQLVNISLSLTGTESSATLDVVSIDLTCGRCRVYKAGAAPTYFVRSGRVGELSASSLPVGMLGDVQDSMTELALSEGDLVVLLSDGMLTGGTAWIPPILENTLNDTPEQIAHSLLEGAKKRRSTRADDTTVTVVRVKNRD